MEEISNPLSSNLPTTTTPLPVPGAADAINPLTSSPSRRITGPAKWPTIDGPLGLSHQDSVAYARRFFNFGFFCLPFLWAVNCFYFWPVLRHPNSHNSHPLLRRYVVGSAIGFLLFAVILSSWSVTFMIGGNQLFGPVWDKLVMYNVAERYGLTELM
ncbi:probable gamma-secretase subunit PEN-2 [Olea europaea var. sylvestris]|uniref:Probable gamma-secretase subunit PEN-2 n=1 Tax=Olea europaea subsp. europaea TaxID=158383 RepID=A0A8S0UAF2_OLEEU|nr:probable gamma-secretase subunit PEN-2 [Olea europaea var. sylvestris]CAA3015993.1 probable gamma-secretase subunit PEN-2 [Olea europaea subsp. europaea]